METAGPFEAPVIETVLFAVAVTSEVESAA
jgi:hypothetical protein